MDWIIDENMRCDIVAWEQPNFSGQAHQVQIFPSGRQGDLPDKLGSLYLAGPIGTRLILVTSTVSGDFLGSPWRAITLQKGFSYRAKNGKPLVKVPHLDFVDAPNAVRTDPDFEQSYAIAETLDPAPAWTYGRPGAILHHVTQIRLGRLP